MGLSRRLDVYSYSVVLREVTACEMRLSIGVRYGGG